MPTEIDSVGSLTQGVEGLRIGLLDEGFVDADPQVRDAVLAAADTLASAGASVARISVPEHHGAARAVEMLSVEGRRAVADIGFFGAFAQTYYPEPWITAVYRLFHDEAERLSPQNKLSMITSEFTRRRFKGALYARAQNVRRGFRNAIDAALETVDVLAMPTCLEVAPQFESDRSFLDVGLQVRRHLRNTNPYNYTGHPALSVPCGKAGRLPIGLQLVGRYFGEPLMMRFAYAYQHSVDWDALIAPAGRSTPDEKP